MNRCNDRWNDEQFFRIISSLVFLIRIKNIFVWVNKWVNNQEELDDMDAMQFRSVGDGAPVIDQLVSE